MEQQWFHSAQKPELTSVTRSTAGLKLGYVQTQDRSMCMARSTTGAPAFNTGREAALSWMVESTVTLGLLSVIGPDSGS